MNMMSSLKKFVNNVSCMVNSVSVFSFILSKIAYPLLEILVEPEIGCQVSMQY